MHHQHTAAACLGGLMLIASCATEVAPFNESDPQQTTGSSTASNPSEADTSATSSGDVSGTAGSTAPTSTTMDSTAGSTTPGSTGTSLPSTGTDASTCPIFFDDFEDAQIDPRWILGNSVAATEEDGELSLAVASGWPYAQVALDDPFVETAARFEIVDPPTQPGSVLNLWITDFSLEGERYDFYVVMRDAGWTLEIGGMFNPVFSYAEPWNSDEPWLQIAERDGQVLFQTSADGVNFTTVYQQATPYEMMSPRAGVVAHTVVPDARPGQVSIGAFEVECFEPGR